MIKTIYRWLNKICVQYFILMDLKTQKRLQNTNSFFNSIILVRCKSSDKKQWWRSVISNNRIETTAINTQLGKLNLLISGRKKMWKLVNYVRNSAFKLNWLKSLNWLKRKIDSKVQNWRWQVILPRNLDSKWWVAGR